MWYTFVALMLKSYFMALFSGDNCAFFIIGDNSNNNQHLLAWNKTVMDAVVWLLLISESCWRCIMKIAQVNLKTLLRWLNNNRFILVALKEQFLRCYALLFYNVTCKWYFNQFKVLCISMSNHLFSVLAGGEWSPSGSTKTYSTSNGHLVAKGSSTPW